MTTYKKILLAVNERYDQELIQKAVQLSKQFEAKLYLVHAVEYITSYGAAYGVAVGADIEETLMRNAQEKMRELCKTIDVSEQDQIVKFGPAKIVILDEAERLKVDLIVIGSHGRHGLRWLMGSTASAVLHTATCDVLAVRLEI
ncbi:MAG: universal stress protein UspA [Coxiella sp. DG_40]|nr:MAG: universal stress protein UspA [Coxiella sp. DG_40]